MAIYYQPKESKGREYVDTVLEFNSVLLHHMMQMPKNWELIIKPIIQSANEIERLVILANKVYVSKDNQTEEEYKKALETRLDYLYRALREFANFDYKFDKLMREIDITDKEKERLKNILIELIKELGDRIEVVSHINSIEYKTVYGNKVYRLKLAPKQKDRIIALESSALNEINKKINADKKLLKAISA